MMYNYYFRSINDVLSVKGQFRICIFMQKLWILEREHIDRLPDNIDHDYETVKQSVLMNILVNKSYDKGKSCW
jgi:hypothetical protein